MKKIRLSLKSLFFGFLIFISVIGVLAQKQGISLKDKKITIHRENESLGTIFGDLINIYDVPIGFEESTFDAKHTDYLFEVNLPVDHGKCVEDCKKGIGYFVNVNCTSVCKQRTFTAKDVKLSINVENEPLEKVLDLIVARMRYYKWEINDDVVNIVPIAGRNKKWEDLLDLKIKSFIVIKAVGIRSENSPTDRSLADIRYSLFYLPEVKEFLKNNNLHFSSTRYGSSNLGKLLDKDLTFSDLTLKELLNKITKSKRGGWALRMSDFFDDAKYEFVDIDI